MEPLVKENGICEVVGPGKEAQMKRTRGRATPELGSRKMRFLSKGNFFFKYNFTKWGYRSFFN